MNIQGSNLTFDIAVHFGTLLSVIFVYKKVLFQIVKELLAYVKSKKANSSVRLFVLVFIGSLPAAFVGIGFKSIFEQMFHSIWVVIAGFYITGIVLYVSQKKARGIMGGDFVEHVDNVDKITVKQAFLIGCAQAIAITPGISRAGSTIAAGLMTGLSRSTAAFFSFMLAIPAIFGAGLLEMRNVAGLSLEEMQIFGFGMLISFLAGIVGLKTVLSFVREGRLHYFSYYVWLLASVLAIYQFRQ